MLEKILYKTINIGSLLFIVLAIIGKVSNAERTSPLVKFTIVYFLSILFIMGLWGTLGTIFRWKTLRKSPKRLNLDHLNGGLRNLIDLSLGIMAMTGSIGVLIWYLRQW